jgi:4-aminobutyrate aminotransferase-like enzyme/Ser/Thr protein kinase RdoA (MazF antagonist)
MTPSGQQVVPDAGSVRRALRESWGDDGAIARLPGDVDANFVVTTAAGLRSILKFVAPGTDRATLDLQHAALRHLAAAEGEPVRTPRVIPTVAGDSIAEFDGRLVRRLSWIDGPTVADAVPARLGPSTATDRFLRATGALVGRVDASLADFEHPGADRRHPWDPLTGGWVADEMGVVEDPARRGILQRVVRIWSDRVAPAARDLPRTVIHGDANDHNLLVEAGAWWKGPVGLIDFGDMLRTARICEPAVTAAYAAMRSTDPVEAVATVTAGWLEAWDAALAGGAEVDGSIVGAESRGRRERVSDDELAIVPVLVRMRLAISVVISARRSRERPDDPYVTVSETGAWRLLEALDHVEPGHVATRVLSACGRARGLGDHSGDRVPPDRDRPVALRPDEDLAAQRSRLTGPNLSLSYSQPIHAVRGWMQHLYDADGTAFLDVYNNVPHVGHSHPRVSEAIARQTSLLATNTRYLSQVRLDYMERLAARFPDPLDTVYLLNSASEANELALRIVRAATDRRDLLVQDGGYHGHTTTLVDVSPYKADGPGGVGTPEWVHTVAVPDVYRGRWRAGRDDDPGGRYAGAVRERVAGLSATGRPPAAFLLETFPSVGGQIVPPSGYLAGAYAAVRDAGGLVIADEVQTGLGRLGAVEWGFETASVVPDLVVLGKPMGNGFPLAAVITTRALAEAFDTGMEFFSTFGGNPVACAAGAAVLDVLDDEKLAENADRVGSRLLEGIHELAVSHEIIGDVRGMGLFVGVEFVSDRATRSPDARAAGAAVEGLKARGILAGTDGPDHNVLKMRGPLVLATADADRILEALGDVLPR